MGAGIFSHEKNLQCFPMKTLKILFKENFEWSDTGQRIGAAIVSGLKSCQTVFVAIDFSPVGSVHPNFYLIPILSCK